MKKEIILMAAALLTLTGCEYEFDLHQDGLDNLVRVECVAGAQDTTFINTSLAVPAQKYESSDKSLNITDMQFTANDVPLQVSKGVFGPSDYRVERHYVVGHFEPGDRLEIKVSASNAATAASSTVIPEVPEVSDVTADVFSTSEDSKYVRFSMDIDKNSSSTGYYGFQVELEIVNDRYYTDDGSPAGEGRTELLVYDSLESPELEGDVLGHLDEGETLSIGFDGANFSGRYLGEMFIYSADELDADGRISLYVRGNLDHFNEHEEYVNIYYGEETEPMQQYSDWEHWRVEYTGRTIHSSSFRRYRVKVYSLSSEFYHYAKAKFFLYNGFDEFASMGLTPPNFTYGNVSEGLGLFGGVSVFVSDWFDNPLVTEK